MKKAILVVSFGSSYHEALKESVIPVEDAIKNAFPDREFKRAFGSKFIIKKILNRDQVKIPTIMEALNELLEEGFEDVIVQPTYFIPGIEYSELQTIVTGYASRFRSIVIGKPLLDSLEDFKNVIQGIHESIPLAEDEALVLMGHGTEHFANTAYPTLEHIIHSTSNAKIFVGTVEGYPEIDHVITCLKIANVKKVKLTAFMLVAGDHARNDMAGDEEDSWKNILLKEGYEVSCLVRGFGSYPFVQEMLKQHALNVE